MDATTYTARLAQCIGKEPFASPQVASKVMRRRAEKPRHRKCRAKKVHSTYEVYHCQHCGLFHIGTRNKSVHARRQRVQDGDDA